MHLRSTFILSYICRIHTYCYIKKIYTRTKIYLNVKLKNVEGRKWWNNHSYDIQTRNGQYCIRSLEKYSTFMWIPMLALWSEMQLIKERTNPTGQLFVKGIHSYVSAELNLKHHQMINYQWVPCCLYKDMFSCKNVFLL